jgi:hypothetical protein
MCTLISVGLYDPLVTAVSIFFFVSLFNFHLLFLLFVEVHICMLNVLHTRQFMGKQTSKNKERGIYLYQQIIFQGSHYKNYFKNVLIIIKFHLK